MSFWPKNWHVRSLDHAESEYFITFLWAAKFLKIELYQTRELVISWCISAQTDNVKINKNAPTTAAMPVVCSLGGGDSSSPERLAVWFSLVWFGCGQNAINRRAILSQLLVKIETIHLINMNARMEMALDYQARLCFQGIRAHVSTESLQLDLNNSQAHFWSHATTISEFSFFSKVRNKNQITLPASEHVCMCVILDSRAFGGIVKKLQVCQKLNLSEKWQFWRRKVTKLDPQKIQS